jgi:hypothetical protein
MAEQSEAPIDPVAHAYGQAWHQYRLEIEAREAGTPGMTDNDLIKIGRTIIRHRETLQQRAQEALAQTSVQPAPQAEEALSPASPKQAVQIDEPLDLRHATSESPDGDGTDSPGHPRKSLRRPGSPTTT